jgi:hypothetical protein
MSDTLRHELMAFNGQSDTHIHSGKPYSTISLRLVWAMASAPTNKPKANALALMASGYSTHDGRDHKVQREQGRFVALRVDVDKGTTALADLRAALFAFAGNGAALCSYSTSSATADAPRWRGLIPLADPVAYDVWLRLQRALHLHLTACGIDFDISMERAGQYFAAPNVPPEKRDADGQPLFYQFDTREGTALDVSTVGCAAALAKLDALDAMANKARAEAAKRAVARRNKPGASTGHTGLIDAVNARYSVADCFRRFGFDTKNANDWHHPQQTSTSYSWRDFGEHWVCISSMACDHRIGMETASGFGAGDAFDLICHFEHGGDMGKAIKALANEIEVTDSATGEVLTWQEKTRRDWMAENRLTGVFPPLDDDAATVWPTPEPFTRHAEPQPYPLDALPVAMREAVEEVVGFVKAPIALAAGSALSALSVAVQGLYDVERAPGLKGPCSLYMLSIAESGERKTTCDGFFKRALEQHQREKTDAMKPHLDDYKADLAVWEAKKAGVLDAIKKATKSGEDTRQFEADMRTLEGSKPKPVRIPTLIRGDDTPENLGWSLMREWPSAGVLSSEAGVVFGGHAMGGDSQTRNLALLNVLWDGCSLKVGRRTSESFTIEGVRLTMGLLVQEVTLRTFFDKSKGLARGTGFLARFLVAWPASTMGTRHFTQAPTWQCLDTFTQRLLSLLRTEPSIDDEGRLSTVTLSLSHEARAIWVQFHDAIETMLAPNGELADVKDVASKVADNAARLACLLHVFENGAGAVGVQAMASGAKLATWHLTEAQRFLGQFALPPEMDKAMRLDAWLLAWCKQTNTRQVSTRDTQQLGPLRDKPTLTTALAELVDMGRVRLVTDGKRKLIEVNPALLEASP